MARWIGILVVGWVMAGGAWAAGEFTDVADELGVAIYASSDQGAGCGFADVDGDGRLDILVVDGLGDPNVLFRQDPLRSFAEVGALAGVDNTGWGKSVTFADYDNDGDPDLLLTRLAGTMVLYRNNGDGTFTDVSVPSGFFAIGSSSYTGAAWADFDNDGWVDVYITRYNNLPNRLMRNRGDGTFEDVAVAAGVTNTTGYGFQPAWFDYDNDGDQDLYISNDIFGSPNALYRNNGDGTFTDVSVASGTGIDMSAMGVAIGDWDNNGFLDLYVANIATGNVFLTNNGDGTFTERAEELGVDVGKVSWGVEFLDYDHDGWLDLYVNVSSDQYLNGPPPFGGVDRARVAMPSGRVEPAHEESRGNDDITNRLYRNLGGTGFLDVSEGSGIQNDGRSFCSAVADYDGDGDLDIYITNWHEFELDKPTALFENNHIPRGGSSSDWLRVQLIGTISNRDGIGARVWLETAAGWQMREHHIGTSYLGSSDPFLHFGTAGTSIIPQVFVRWPSGITEVHENIPAGQILTLIEGDGVPSDVSPTGPLAALRSPVRVVPNPVRNDAELRLRLVTEDGWVSIVDASGRGLRSFRVRGLPGEEVGIPWDVRGADQVRVAAGRYFVVARSGDQRSTNSIIVLR